jgi:hypothetical protein
VHANSPMMRILPVEPGAAFVFLVDAVVVEDDTYLVLGADPVPRETYEEPEQLAEGARASIEPAPGTLVVRGGHPARFHAIVHDLNEEPSWKEEWVASALREAFREAETREFHSISLPLLGGVHGSLAPDRFAELLGDALADTTNEQLDEVWLTVPGEAAGEMATRLRAFGIEVREEGQSGEEL